MQKLFILLLSASLLFACNNNDNKTKNSNNDKAINNGKDSGTNGNENMVNNRNEAKTDENKMTMSQWSSADVKEFFRKCTNTAISNGADRKAAEDYCSCMQEKMEKKYPDPNDMTGIDKENPEVKSMADECKIATGVAKKASKGWSRQQELKFVNECVNAAEKGGMEYLDAQSYCDCMQYELAKIYPNAADAEKLTEADLSTPAMKRLVNKCLPGDY